MPLPLSLCKTERVIMIKNKQNKKPLISVIMPVYNYEAYLEEAIDSILNQTYSNFEFIIVDDASTDDSSEIILKYQKQYPKKIKVMSLKKNLNCGGDRCTNEGIKIARGKYLARMDADDIALPARLEKQVEFLENNPDIFLVGSNAYVIDRDGKIMGEKTEPESNEKIYNNYLTFHPLIHPSCMYRRRLNNKKNFQYEIIYKSNNDYLTFFKLICENYKFANIKEGLLLYRIHEQSNTFRNVKMAFFTTLRIRFSMILKYHYRPTLKAIITNFAQIILVSLLPKELIVKLYFLFKGIAKTEKLANLSTPTLIYSKM